MATDGLLPRFDFERHEDDLHRATAVTVGGIGLPVELPPLKAVATPAYPASKGLDNGRAVTATQV